MEDYDHNGLAARITRRLKDLEISPRSASLQAGASADLIRGVLRGSNKSIRGDHLVGLARVLKVSEAWLVNGDTSQEPSDPDVEFGVRFGGVVEAGAFRRQNDLSQDDDYRLIPMPHDARFPRNSQFAFTVVGDSMTRERIFEGMHVLAVDILTWDHLQGQPRDGQLVVVARAHNGHPERELTVKKLKLFTDRMELQPCSDNPAYTPLVFPLPLREDDQQQAHIIAVVLSATWIYG
jgi:SOS-response transcriptional repressor LexA